MLMLGLEIVAWAIVLFYGSIVAVGLFVGVLGWFIKLLTALRLVTPHDPTKPY